MGQVNVLYKLFRHIKLVAKKKLYNGINKIKLDLNGITYGKGISIVGPIYIYRGNNSKITIGNNLHVTSGLGQNPLSRNIKTMFHIKQDACLTIGNNVGISSSCIWANNAICIGNNVNIGGDSIIIDSDIHSISYLDRREPLIDTTNSKSAQVTIEDDVFIGTRCIVLKGVHIGARSIIAAGSVVSRSIPSDCIAGGNPCNVIKKIK